MKFLIDECIHTSLVTVAHEAGHVCDHVNFAGLVIILPSVSPQHQRELCQAALLHAGARDLTNTVVEVELAGRSATCREYSYPPKGSE